jgi:hypothetical protein
MGRLTRPRPQPDQAYDPRVTDLSRPLNIPGVTGPQAGIPWIDPSTGLTTSGAAINPQGGPTSGGWINRNVSNTIPFNLVAGVSVRALPYNQKRTGLIIQNKDAVNALNVSFANDLGANGMQISAGVTVLLDFTTPPDTVYLFANVANIQCIVIEYSRAGS